MSHERRIFLDERIFLREEAIGFSVPIAKVDQHHLQKVLRLREGDEVIVVERNSGKEFVAEIQSWKSGEVRVIKPLNKLRSPIVVRGLLPALCKGPTNEMIVEKATELGIELIAFWEASRSVVKFPTPEERGKKSARFRKIAEEAAKQSARNSIPEVCIFPSLAEASKTIEKEGLLFWGSLQPAAKLIASLSSISYPSYIVIGPEGDFTPEEERFLEERKATSFSLGSNRLKVETAAVAAIAVFNEVGRKEIERAVDDSPI